MTFAALLLTACLGLAEPAPDTLVICPIDLQPGLANWVEYRRRQGHRIRVQPPSSTAVGIRRQVRSMARLGHLQHLVIVGDAADPRLPAQRLVPTDYVPAKVNVHFGSEPEISSDNTYADLDGDGVPDLTLGRITVDSNDELRRYVQRVIEYESGGAAGDWMRRMNFVAGVGGFGQLVDRMIEQSTKRIITDLVPPAYETSMTYGSWSSPYCPNPERFSDTAIERFNEGCLFWCYIGHGSQRRLDRVMLPDRRCEILDCERVRMLNARQGAPIAVFLACYTGAIDGPEDCLSEEMLRQPQGPIAVISSTRVAMPYAMALLSLELLDGYFHGSSETLGQLMLEAKQKLVRNPERPDRYRQLVEAMGQAFSPKPELLDAERREHVHLMHLWGDPLLRLQRPQAIQLEIPERVEAGMRLRVRGESPGAGPLTIDICYRRDRYRKRPPRRSDYDPSPEALQRYDEVYRETQQLTCWRTTLEVPAGPFELEAVVPADANGDCFVRAMVDSNTGFALGAAPFFIEPKRP